MSMNNGVDILSVLVNTMVEADAGTNFSVSCELVPVEIKFDNIFKFNLFEALVKHIGPILLFAWNTHRDVTPNNPTEPVRTKRLASSKNLIAFVGHRSLLGAIIVTKRRLPHLWRISNRRH